MKIRAATLAAFVFCGLSSSVVWPGSYYVIDQAVRLDIGIGPFAIVHPIGFDGSGGEIEIRVCVDPASKPTGANNDFLVGPTQQAIAIWNALSPVTGNCTEEPCLVWEDTTAPSGGYDAMSLLLHELGHCAMGLGHIDLSEIAGTPFQGSGGNWFTGTCDLDTDGCCLSSTSFANSVNAEEVVSTAGVRGDELNMQQMNCPTAPFPPNPQPTLAECLAKGGGVVCPMPKTCCPNPTPVTPPVVQDISWFRIPDNDPFVLDDLAIDSTTFSRSTSNLPAGHNYARAANRLVGGATYPDTQAVMYGGATRQTVFSGITADEANMVKMAMTGADRLLTGPASDDYTYVLRYQAD